MPGERGVDGNVDAKPLSLLLLDGDSLLLRLEGEISQPP
jgi:hypothetical protein